MPIVLLLLLFAAGGGKKKKKRRADTLEGAKAKYARIAEATGIPYAQLIASNMTPEELLLAGPGLPFVLANAGIRMGTGKDILGDARRAIFR
ncbi:MAG TPA: hypothetical protein VEA38_11620 [Terriglobales bacterium]|nr:hypothetical protein [Terriglobales bacterium]